MLLRLPLHLPLHLPNPPHSPYTQPSLSATHSSAAPSSTSVQAAVRPLPTAGTSMEGAASR